MSEIIAGNYKLSFEALKLDIEEIYQLKLLSVQKNIWLVEGAGLSDF